MKQAERPAFLREMMKLKYPEENMKYAEGSVLLIWAMALCAEKNKFRFRDIELGLLKSASMSL